ncbi:MAG: alpha-1,2-fucosyltransferase [Oligoflexia bacterium]|nr:alpha-1,2-fucosyltransferase [Oligoflexia bacterium]
MVIVKLVGGLGNQLFQYAFGRALSIRQRSTLFLDCTAFETYKVHDYALDHFNIQAESATQEQIKKLTKPASQFFFFNRTPKIYKEPHFHYSEKHLQIKGSIYLEGYWQSEKYFEGIAEQLREDLRIISQPDENNEGALKKIRETNSVSIHIRRGDYVSNAAATQVHGILDLDYYRKSIDFIYGKFSSPSFFVFSDDPEWVRNNLKIEGNATYVNHNPPQKGYEDLRLMSSCKHHIIANSTFSWWGAWLNPLRSKTVIAPRNWFRTNDLDPEDLIPINWIRL